MTEEDQRRQQFITDSKHKLNPYLITHFNKTEQFTAGSAVDPWEPVFDPNDLCAFTNYMEYINISYWWKMNGNYLVIGDSEPNAGNAGIMPLKVRPWILTEGIIGVLSNRPPLAARTCVSGKSIYKQSWRALHHADVIVDGTKDFTMGGWFKIQSSREYDGAGGIFMTNIGNSYRSGIHVRPRGELSTPAYIAVTPSRFSAGQNKTYTSPAGSIILDQAHFIVLRVIPTLNTSTLQFDLFIDGVKQTMTPDATPDHPIGWNTEDDSFRPLGIYYNGYDGQTTGSSEGGYDELFFHWGLLSDHQILQLYIRGAA